MKSKFIYLTITAALLIMSGCKKFLVVQPKNQYTEDQVFANEVAIQQALNGIYDNMASDSLYGANLSTLAVEFLGQRWNTGSYTGSALGAYDVTAFNSYTYSDPGVQKVFNDVWTTAYTDILQANQFIEKIDVAQKNGIISAPHATELKGEAIGIRAFLHFDLLRLFGPVMQTSPTNAAIPYYTKADGTVQPILNAKQVVTNVLADLNTAKGLLAADPIVGNGPDTSSLDYYAGHRNQRFNYYAVIALQARVYLYEGDKADANAAAKQSLSAIDQVFPWTPFSAVLANDNPDRIFSSEVIFGVYNQYMYVNYQKYFSPALTTYQIITAIPSVVNTVFEGNQNDYRYSPTWITGATGVTFYKYADLSDANKPWRFFQPLIRKSELYYILAETEPSTADGINYLNTVRNNRGLVNLASNADLPTEIGNEYTREFWGEGQLFYYWKRNNFSYVYPSSTGSYAYPVYQVPLPLSETTPR